jgi:hypothetical protein
MGSTFNLDCRLTFEHWDYVLDTTQCSAINLTIEKRDEIVTSVNDHNGSFVVKIFHIYEQNVNYFPRGLGNNFPALEGLALINSNLMALEKCNLEPFTNLTELIMYKNQIEILTSDLFERNPNIRSINFRENKLKVIGENLLSSLTFFKDGKFERNVCIPQPINGSGMNSRELSEIFKQKCKMSEELKVYLNANKCQSDSDFFIDKIRELQNDVQVFNLKEQKNENLIADLGAQTLNMSSELKDDMTENLELKDEMNSMRERFLSCNGNLNSATKNLFLISRKRKRQKKLNCLKKSTKLLI